MNWDGPGSDELEDDYYFKQGIDPQELEDDDAADG